MDAMAEVRKLLLYGKCRPVHEPTTHTIQWLSVGPFRKAKVVDSEAEHAAPFMLVPRLKTNGAAVTVLLSKPLWPSHRQLWFLKTYIYI